MSPRLLSTALLALSAHHAAGDLEVGTAFGANWIDVEDELRQELFTALEDVRSSCASEASCPADVAAFCGFNGDHHDRTFVYKHGSSGRQETGRTAFYDTLPELRSSRHVFDQQCEAGQELTPGCYFDTCLYGCFEDEDMLSNRCLSSLRMAEHRANELEYQEESDDQREVFYRYSIPLMAVLSMLSSILTCCLHRHQKLAGSSTLDATCERVFLVVDVITAGLLLAIVLLFCPLLLVVIAPPHLMVQAVYFLCFAPKKVEDSSGHGDEYHILDEEDHLGRTGSREVTTF